MYGYRRDGEYFLYLNWPECKNGAVVYCSNMISNAPLEYVPLPEGVEKNLLEAGTSRKGWNQKLTFIRYTLSFLSVKKQMRLTGGAFTR